MSNPRSILWSFGSGLLALSAVALAMGVQTSSQQLTASTPAPPAHLTSEQDHQRTMDLLHITSLRPGIGGTAANTDESKANPYPSLPDPLVLNNGKKVKSAKVWWGSGAPRSSSFSIAKSMGACLRIRRR